MRFIDGISALTVVPGRPTFRAVCPAAEHALDHPCQLMAPALLQGEQYLRAHDATLQPASMHHSLTQSQCLKLMLLTCLLTPACQGCARSTNSPSSSNLSCIHCSSTTSSSCGLETREKWMVVDIFPAYYLTVPVAQLRSSIQSYIHVRIFSESILQNACYPSTRRVKEGQR